MRATFTISGLGSLLLLGGCMLDPTKASKDYGVMPLALDKDSASMQLRNAIEKHTVKDAAGKDAVEGIVDQNCFDIPVDPARAPACKQQRNAALATLLVASDDLCQAHLRTIYGNDAYFNIVTGSVATLFSGAAAIAGSASAKAALASISTFSNAERSLINETVYKNMLVTATSKKIREVRATKVAAMLPGNFGKPIDEYPVILALRDAVDYHYSCSFMLGLEKALEEGTQSNVAAKMAVLEQEKRNLEMYVSNRTATLSVAQPQRTPEQVAADPGIAGANARIAAIEAQLLTLANAQTPGAASGEKAGEKAPPMADPAALSKAYYAMVAAIESASGALGAKIAAAKAPAPADGTQSLTDALKAVLAAKKAQVAAALATQSCTANLDKLSKDIAETQGRMAAASGDEKTKQGDALAALQVQAGRLAVRLGAFEALYTTTMAAQGAALDAAKSAVDATLKSQIEGAVNGVVTPAALCAI